MTFFSHPKPGKAWEKTLHCTTLGLIGFWAGLVFNASPSREDVASYLETEEKAWRYIEENDLVAVVLPVLSTGSMGPELHGNHLAVVESVPFDDIQIGDIAVFLESGKSNPTAHLVEDILPDGRLITRGRTNTSFDPLVTRENFLGVVVKKFEYRSTQRWVQSNWMES